MLSWKDIKQGNGMYRLVFREIIGVIIKDKGKVELRHGNQIKGNHSYNRQTDRMKRLMSHLQ
jgi:hypothetical protein